MIIKKYSILIFILFLSVNSNYSQRWKLMRYEVMTSVAPTFGQNDIVGVKQYTLDNWFGLEEAFAVRNFGLSGFLGARYRFTEKISFRLSIDGGLLRGKDGSSRGTIRKFNTLFFEPSLHFEYYLIKEGFVGAKYSIMDYRGGVNSRAKRNMTSVYVFGGLGGLFYLPKVNDEVKNTETYTVNESFNKIIVIPGGIGVKRLITSRNSIGIEIGGRYTAIPSIIKNGDYIDGFNTSASKSNDIYGFINIIWSYKLRTNKNGLPMFRGN